MRAVPADFQRAVGFLQQGDLERAERLCNKVLSVDRQHADALHLLGLIALQRGRAATAIELIGKSLSVHPAQPVAHLNMGNALLELGRFREALLSCDQALALRPDYAEAHNNRGTALLELQRPLEALASYERALRLKPNLAVLHNNRGNALRELGRHQPALASYEQALSLQGDFEQALLARGEMLHALGRLGEALDCLRQASQLAPRSATVWVSLGNVLFKLERGAEALASYQRALELAPHHCDAAYNCGTALLHLKRFTEALQCYDRALTLNPEFAKAHFYRGYTLSKLQHPAQALDSFMRALQIDPAYVDAATGIGNALRDLGRESEALAGYDRALRLNPQCVEALSARANVALHLRRPEEAGADLERLLKIAPDIAPDFNYALGMMLHARQLCCDWREYDSLSDAVIAAVNRGKRVTLPALFIAVDGSPGEQLLCARQFIETSSPSAAAPLWKGEQYQHGKIRLAYISADFREHPVSHLMAAVFEAHDRVRFETLAISLRPEQNSPLGRRARAAFDRFIDVAQCSDADVAALLREMEVDIAVDLTGHTDGCRPGIFALRPAPIQVNYLGYAGTSAAPAIDYILADRQIIPFEDQRFYTEKVVYLPDCYQPNDSGRAISQRTPTRAEAGLPAQGLVFCCFNSHFKITPQIFAVWMRLLRAIEGSVLWLNDARESAVRNLRLEAATRGVDPQRLVFAPRLVEISDHLARYRLADLFLDTLPFNAHTTASDALWTGLPVLTCRGRSFAGRVAASLLTTLNLPELITTNLAEYESTALQLASSPTLLGQLRARVTAERNSSALFDTRRFTRNIEAAYIQMWERCQRGEGPVAFVVKKQE